MSYTYHFSAYLPIHRFISTSYSLSLFLSLPAYFDDWDAPFAPLVVGQHYPLGHRNSHSSRHSSRARASTNRALEHWRNHSSRHRASTNRASIASVLPRGEGVQRGGWRWRGGEGVQRGIVVGSDEISQWQPLTTVNIVNSRVSGGLSRINPDRVARLVSVWLGHLHWQHDSMLGGDETTPTPVPQTIPDIHHQCTWSILYNKKSFLWEKQR